jgi:hypothetical protein
MRQWGIGMSVGRSRNTAAVFAVILVLWAWEARSAPLDRPLNSSGETYASLIGSCSTRLDGNPDRTHNIRLCARRLNNRILSPGSRFSFNYVVGKRTLGRGFRKAPVLFLDEMSERVGGGVCQVSSTLYNAALLADLMPVERYKHSSRVYYVPVGQDATVSYGHRDLILLNPFDFPVRLRAHAGRSALTVSFYAERPLPYQVRIERTIRDIEAPFDTSSARPGLEVRVYRVRVGPGGEETHRERISVDRYPPVYEWEEGYVQ